MPQCKSCGAEIMWAKTQAGRLTPVDAAESPDGNVWVAMCEGTLTAFFPPAGTGIPDATRHKSHFATCPNSAQHRKPKGGVA